MLDGRNSRQPTRRGTRHIKLLIDGVWHGSLEETPAIRAELAGRASGGFHHWVTADGSSRFPAEPGRYHLYVSYACPWAHRTILYRKLKGLEDVISMSVLHPRWAGPDGWRFDHSEFSTVDHLAGRQFLHEVYRAARPDYTGRVTVPVLWDRETNTIVNNESSDIMRMLNSAFDAWGDASVDFYPASLRSEITELNAWLIPEVCAGVYRAGFARSQNAYERAVRSVFQRLDQLEERLSRQPYLLGEKVTESDWHLFATLCRFDAAYFGALKCNLRRLVDYPALSAYTWRLHEMPGVRETVRLDHIKRHYYDDIGEIDPTIVPLGPAIDFTSIDYTGRESSGGVRSFDDANESAANGSNNRFLAEVLDLHVFLEDWLKGNVLNTGSGPTRLADALSEDFVVIHPNGRREGKFDVIRNFAAAYGNKPDGYRLRISDTSLRMLGRDTCLVTYKETHAGEPGRTRISSALLRKQPASGMIKWLFLQETLVAATSLETAA